MSIKGGCATASERTGSAQAFLTNKIEILRRYVGGTSAAPLGLHDYPVYDSVKRSAPSQSDIIREQIRLAQYSSFQLIDGGINQSVVLKNGVKVVFKPKAGEDPIETNYPPGVHKGTQYLREKAASIIDELLGIGLVPPTEIITYEGLVGSAQVFQDSYTTARHLEATGAITLPCFDKLTDRQRQDWQLIDELIGNGDRHAGNWMLRSRVDGKFDLALIDNGRSFPEIGESNLFVRPASRMKIDSINRDRLERLLTLEREWRTKLTELVGVAAIEHMINRAQKLLRQGYYE
ncbi:MAG: hypothetical protein KGL39_57590 [Patescibacteria group bacterium]|nr:hypothetical protein [Patescibacteria group bacterium]